jgi:hypothetical protein
VELRTLFGAVGVAQDSLKALQVFHRQRLQRWRLVGEIVDMMERFESVAPTGLKTDHLYLLLSAQAMSGTLTPSDAATQQDVTDTVKLLSNPALGILAEVNGSTGAYQLTVTADTARKLIRSFARSLESASSRSTSAVTKLAETPT